MVDRENCRACRTKNTVYELIQLSEDAVVGYCLFCSHTQKMGMPSPMLVKLPDTIPAPVSGVRDIRFDLLDKDMEDQFSMVSVMMASSLAGLKVSTESKVDSKVQLVYEKSSSLDFKLDYSEPPEFKSHYKEAKEAAERYTECIRKVALFVSEYGRKVVAYGANDRTVNVLKYMQFLGFDVQVAYLVDEDPELQEKLFRDTGLVVHSPGCLHSEATLTVLDFQENPGLENKLGYCGGSFQVVSYYPDFNVVVPRG